MVLDVF
jgi:hypothetical protein